METIDFILAGELFWNLQPDLSGNPFLWLEKRGQKDWERKAEIAAQNFSFDRVK